MTTKKYLVSLDKDLVDRIKLRIQVYGGRLSPIVNNLLKLWDHNDENMMKLIKELNNKEVTTS